MAALRGQPRAIVDEVVTINAQARDRAVGWALASIGLVGFIGFGAAMRFPISVLPAEEPSVPVYPS